MFSLCLHGFFPGCPVSSHSLSMQTNWRSGKWMWLVACLSQCNATHTRWQLWLAQEPDKSINCVKNGSADLFFFFNCLNINPLCLLTRENLIPAEQTLGKDSRERLKWSGTVTVSAEQALRGAPGCSFYLWLWGLKWWAATFSPQGTSCVWGTRWWRDGSTWRSPRSGCRSSPWAWSSRSSRSGWTRRWPENKKEVRNRRTRGHTERRLTEDRHFEDLRVEGYYMILNVDQRWIYRDPIPHRSTEDVFRVMAERLTRCWLERKQLTDSKNSEKCDDSGLYWP